MFSNTFFDSILKITEKLVNNLKLETDEYFLISLLIIINKYKKNIKKY